MKFALLARFAELLREHKSIHNIKRIADNLFKLECDFSTYYIDLSRASSTIFIAPLLLSIKRYQAPFDTSLEKYVTRANIVDSCVEEGNRILKITLENRGSYKSVRVVLQLEFTGRNTNMILLNEHGIVIDALRHIGADRSFREVKIGQILAPLPPCEIKEKPLEENLDTVDLLVREYQKRTERELKERQDSSVMAISKRRERLLVVLGEMPNEASLESQALELKDNGTLLLANLYKIEQFKPILELDGRSIELPSQARSLSEAARIFFETSKKLAQKAKNLHIERESLEDKITFYNRQIALIKQAKSIEDVAILSPKRTQKIKTRDKKEEFESFFIEGFKISFGKNERENARLLESAKAEDTWLHVREFPASHMIIHSGKGKIPDAVSQKAAMILVGFVEALGGSYSVDFTKRKFVKIIDGAQVNYSKYGTITVKKE